MNIKQLDSIAKIVRCTNCGMGKYVLRKYTAIPIITMDETSKCCNDPRYYWEWEDTVTWNPFVPDNCKSYRDI